MKTHFGKQLSVWMLWLWSERSFKSGYQKRSTNSFKENSFRRRSKEYSLHGRVFKVKCNYKEQAYRRPTENNDITFVALNTEMKSNVFSNTTFIFDSEATEHMFK